MHAVFWIMTLLMTVVALLFALAPLARAQQRKALAVLAVAVPAFATLGYLALGSPDVTGATAHDGATQPGHRSAAAGHVVAGRISLSPAAEDLVHADDAVYVFARPPGQAGAPVAVIRTTADAWPLEFRLTDSHSITGGGHLSDHAQVVVTARVSRRGGGSATSRRLEAKSPPIDVASTAPVQLTIR